MITEQHIREAFIEKWDLLSREVSKPNNCSLMKGAAIIFEAGAKWAIEELSKPKIDDSPITVHANSDFALYIKEKPHKGETHVDTQETR